MFLASSHTTEIVFASSMELMNGYSVFFILSFAGASFGIPIHGFRSPVAEPMVG